MHTPPAETWATIELELADLGITRIGDRSAFDRHRQISLAVCTRPLARSFATTYGHGPDLLAAKVSAAMASIERFAAERAEVPVRIARGPDLPAMIDPTLWPQRLSARYSPERSIPWVLGDELIEGGHAYVPFELVHADESNSEIPTIFRPSTTGLSAGITRVEANLYGLLEVIERDAEWIFAHAPAWNERRIAFATKPERIARIEEADVRVWDLTTDLGVPVIRVLISDGESFLGVAARPNKDDALDAAISEAIAARAEHDAGGPWSIARRRLRVLSRERTRLVSELCTGSAGRAWAEVVSADEPTAGGALAWTLDKLEYAEISHAVSVTLLAEPVFVVRVAIPGLEAPREGNDYVPGPRARGAG